MSVRARLIAAMVATVCVAGGCDEPDRSVEVQVVEGDPSTHDQALTDDIFDGMSAETVVASVDGTEIVVSDVAAWLDIHPGLTVEQAVQDLVDARRAAGAARALQTAENQRRVDIIQRDARIRARFIAWHRMNVLEDPDIDPPTDLVDAWVAEPFNTTRYGRPALAMASQVLLFVPEGADDEVWEAARDAARTLVGSLQDGPVDTRRLVDAGRAIEEVVSDEAGFSVRTELGMIFPEVESGVPTWPGIQVVVDVFAEAVFAAPPGDLVGPVETDYGVHVILVEGRLPAVIPDEQVIRDTAIELLTGTRRRQRVIERMTELRPDLEIQLSEADINLLALSGVERAAAVAERRAATLR